MCGGARSHTSRELAHGGSSHPTAAIPGSRSPNAPEERGNSRPPPRRPGVPLLPCRHFRERLLVGSSRKGLTWGVAAAGAPVSYAEASIFIR